MPPLATVVLVFALASVWKRPLLLERLAVKGYRYSAVQASRTRTCTVPVQVHLVLLGSLDMFSNDAVQVPKERCFCTSQGVFWWLTALVSHENISPSIILVRVWSTLPIRHSEVMTVLLVTVPATNLGG